MNFLKRGMLISLSTAMVAVLMLLLRASPVRAQVQDLCIVELDAADTVTVEPCNTDETGLGAAPAGNNLSWDNIIAATSPAELTPPSGNAGPGQFTGVVADQGNVFRGTKISTPIGSWKWAKGSSPSKATFQQGALDAYTYSQNPAYFSGGPATGDEIIYYLITRLTNNGDELHGLWILVNPLTQNANGTFTGAHATGDLFILGTFTGGGGSVGIAVFKWTGDDATGSLQSVGTLAQCTTSGGSFVCGQVNSNTINVPGSLSNANTGTSLAAGLFFNGGVDVSQIFGGPQNVPCFGAIVFESVSSASCSPSSCSALSFTASSVGSAEAKDFFTSPFNTCKANVDKVCGLGTGSFSTADITYPIHGILSNGDGGTLTFSSITDSAPGTIAGDTNGLDPGSLLCTKVASCTDTDADCGACAAANMGSCTGLTLGPSGGGADKICYQATFTADSSQCNNGCKDTVTATVTGPAGSKVPPATAFAFCSFNAAQAGLNVTKYCNTQLVSTGSALQVQVNTKYLVCNEFAAPLTNVTLSDKRNGSSTGVPIALPTTTLTPEGTGSDCVTATDTYTPTALPSDATSGTCPNGTFMDTATAMGSCNGNLCTTGTGQNCTVSGSTVTCTAVSNTASCPLCPLAAPTPFPGPAAAGE